MVGKEKKVKMYKDGKLIKTYNNISECSRDNFGQLCQTYLSSAFGKNNGVYTCGNITFVRTAESGTTEKYKRYIVKDKKLNKTFNITSTKKLLSIIEYGHNNFHRQMRIYGNYEDERFNVWVV